MARPHAGRAGERGGEHVFDVACRAGGSGHGSTIASVFGAEEDGVVADERAVAGHGSASVKNQGARA
jgi:hypothetical protein